MNIHLGIMRLQYVQSGSQPQSQSVALRGEIGLKQPCDIFFADTDTIIGNFQQELNGEVELPLSIDTTVTMQYNPALKSVFLFVPGVMTLILLLVSKFVNSQAAALAALVPVALATALVTVFLVGSIVKTHRGRVQTGLEGLTGTPAVADAAFSPQGGQYARHGPGARGDLEGGQPDARRRGGGRRGPRPGRAHAPRPPRRVRRPPPARTAGRPGSGR